MNKEPTKYRKIFSQSLEIDNRINSINTKRKEKKKNADTNNKTTSMIYNVDDKLNTKYLIDNLFVENKEEKIQTSKINEMDSEPTILHKYNVHKRNKIIKEPITKQMTFNLSYIPLSLICQKEEKNKMKTHIDNINELLIFKFL